MLSFCLSDVLALKVSKRETILNYRSIQLFFWVLESLYECDRLPASALLLHPATEDSISQLMQSASQPMEGDGKCSTLLTALTAVKLPIKTVVRGAEKTWIAACPGTTHRVRSNGWPSYLGIVDHHIHLNICIGHDFQQNL